MSQDTDLASRDISGVIKEMKAFNSKRKFKAVAQAIIMSNRIKNMLKGRSKNVVATIIEEEEN